MCVCWKSVSVVFVVLIGHDTTRFDDCFFVCPRMVVHFGRSASGLDTIPIMNLIKKFGR